MKRFAALALVAAVWLPLPALADDAPVTYWDSAAGQVLRARIPASADYWSLAPHFTTQATQTFCGVASAVTVLNALPLPRPVDPAYAPYGYFTQQNFFSPTVAQLVPVQRVLEQGMTRGEMAAALRRHGAKVAEVAGDALDEAGLRTLLQQALGDDGRFVLANYLRGRLGQVGAGHWSVLAAYDAASDSVLILDVARHKYPPAWVTTPVLARALNTLDAASGQPRGLVLVSSH